MLSGLIQVLQDLYNEVGEMPVYLNLDMKEGSTILGAIYTIDLETGPAVILTPDVPNIQEGQ